MSYIGKKTFFKNLIFFIPPQVYEPAEDSFLFADNIFAASTDYVLDVGTGCGILGIIASKKAKEVVAIDVNSDALYCAYKNSKINCVKNINFVRSDLFSCFVKKPLFDLIMFNSPYLPVEENNDTSLLSLAWDGGSTGRKSIELFINNSSNYLSHKGRILLLQSSLSDIKKTFDAFINLGMNPEIIAEQKLPFFEKIVLIEVTK